MKISTKTFQGVAPLLKVCTDPLTEDNNRNSARVSPTEIFGGGGVFGQQDWVATRQASGIIYTN